jgi:hypothetical protein
VESTNKKEKIGIVLINPLKELSIPLILISEVILK